jgi:Arc/MetJ family transcription regulator
MRTNIVLDDKLVEEAFHFANVSTKRELVDLALREFIENHRRANLLQLRGKVKLAADYDYKKARTRNGQ